jgi:hypothetical protein
MARKSTGSNSAGSRGKPVANTPQPSIATTVAYSGSTGGGLLVPQAVTMTVPDHDNVPQHLLTEEQLDSFTEFAKDTSFDWFLGLAAATLGFSQNALTVAKNIWNHAPLGKIDILLSFFFVLLLGGAISKWFEYRKVRPKLETRIAKIRERPKVTIRVSEIQSAAPRNGHQDG